MCLNTYIDHLRKTFESWSAKSLLLDTKLALFALQSGVNQSQCLIVIIRSQSRSLFAVNYFRASHIYPGLRVKANSCREFLPMSVSVFTYFECTRALLEGRKVLHPIEQFTGEEYENKPRSNEEATKRSSSEGNKKKREKAMVDSEELLHALKVLWFSAQS